MVCYMSHRALNKEQKEGGGGLLVAQGSSLLPARRKDGSVLKAFHSLQPETFALNLLLPSFQQSRTPHPPHFTLLEKCTPSL